MAKIANVHKGDPNSQVIKENILDHPHLEVDTQTFVHADAIAK